MGLLRQCTVLLVLALGIRHGGAAYKDECGFDIPEKTWVPIASSSCEERPTGNDSCVKSGTFFEDTDFVHRGSELTNGNLVFTSSDEECCKLCKMTPGCKIWTRFSKSLPFNSEGTCWIKSSAPKPLPGKDGLNGGVIKPPVEELSQCRPQHGVGISNMVAYSDPDLLHTEEWKTCCLWCQADDQFCTGWTWSSGTKKCHLFGNVVDKPNLQLCRDCVSGTRTASRDSVKNTTVCQNGGEAGVKYVGSGRIVLAPEGSFSTKSSQECCGLCDAIKDCRSWSWKAPNECMLNADVPSAISDREYSGGIARVKACSSAGCDAVEGIFMEGKDLFCSQHSAPSNKYLVLKNKDECCLRCLEILECRAWSYSSGRPNDGHPVCSLKINIPSRGQFDPVEVGDSEEAWSGIIRSRCTADQTNDFLERAQAARNQILAADSTGALEEEIDKKNNRLVIIVVAVVVSIFLLCVFVFAGCIAIDLLKKKRANKYNAEIKESVERRRPPDSSPFISTFPTNPATRGSSNPSTQDTISVSVENSTVEPSSSAASKSHGLANSIPYPGEVKSNEKKLQFLKSRMASLLGPEERFSSSFSFADEEWSKVKEVLSEIELGIELSGKYVIDGHIHMGENSIVMSAQQKFNLCAPVVLKFFREQKFHDTELSLYQKRLESLYIPQVFDVYDSNKIQSWGLPPLACIVMERGNHTLTEWLRRHQPELDHMDERNILFKVCRAVQHLHENEIVHRDLKPENIVIFNDTLTWKLIDFGSWAQRGTTSQLEYTLRYAAPELLGAHATQDVVQVMPSIDMWSLGLIFWEVLTGDSLLGEEYSKEEVMAMLVGVEPLPFEKHPELWHRVQNSSARRLVMNLLQRNPIKRWSIQKVLQNGFFMTAPDTVQLAKGQQQFADTLQVIKGAVERVDRSVQQVKHIAVENLKQTVGSILVACFSFYEVDPSETVASSDMGSEFADKYADKSLKMTKTPIEPTYKVFKTSKEEPAMLLRLERRHILKITLMYGGDVAMDLPISRIVFARISPPGEGGDQQEMQVSMMFHKGHLMEGVGVWNTMDHSSAALKLVGNSSIEICIGVEMKGSNDVVEIRKTVDLRMFPPEENFRVVKGFARSKEWYSNLPRWSKIYIHGAVTVVSLASKLLL